MSKHLDDDIDLSLEQIVRIHHEETVRVAEQRPRLQRRNDRMYLVSHHGALVRCTRATAWYIDAGGRIDTGFCERIAGQLQHLLALGRTSILRSCDRKPSHECTLSVRMSQRDRDVAFVECGSQRYAGHPKSLKNIGMRVSIGVGSIREHSGRSEC